MDGCPKANRPWKNSPYLKKLPAVSRDESKPYGKKCLFFTVNDDPYWNDRGHQPEIAMRRLLFKLKLSVFQLKNSLIKSIAGIFKRTIPRNQVSVAILLP
jgi:hypothetical protein